MCIVAAALLVSAIGCLILGSALAPNQSSLRGHAIQLQRLDGAAARSFDGLRRRLDEAVDDASEAVDDASGLCCILNGVDGVDFKYNDPCFCNVEDIMPRSQFSDLAPRELCDANGYGWCPSRVNPGDDAIDAARCEAYGLGCDERYLPVVPVPSASFAPTSYAPTPSRTRRRRHLL